MRQLHLSKFNASPRSFGGSLLKSGTHPKIARPLDSKKPIHLVLRAERSAMRLPRNFLRVNRIVEEVARKYAVRVYEYANCGNHLHHVIKIPKRGTWAAFIRELTGRLARLTGVRWQGRPFTRVVDGWRKAFKIVKSYVKQNQIEIDLRLSRHAKTSLLKRLWPLDEASKSRLGDSIESSS